MRRSTVILALAFVASKQCSAFSFVPSPSLSRNKVHVFRKPLSYNARSSGKLFMADEEVTKSAMMGGSGLNNAGEPPFEIRGFSLGNVVILAGVLVTVLSFVEYLGASGGEGLNVSGLGFVYGIPIFLAGAALKYAEIEPVPCYTKPGAESVFDKKATDTIQKIKQDVTRHRYGDEAHLDTTVKRLGLVIPGKDYPQLQELREEVSDDGELVFTIVWQSLDTPYKMWADERRVKKYETFFGPGVTAECVKIDAEQRKVGIKLTTINPTAKPAEEPDRKSVV